MLFLLSLQSPVFDPRPVHVGCSVDHITEIQVLVLLLRSTAVSIVQVDYVLHLFLLYIIDCM
jgi:hypothetical protein